MKYSYFQWFFYLFLTILVSHCASAQKSAVPKSDQLPDWVTNPMKYYPEDEYIVGVGSGDTRQAAEDDAVGNIARVFQSKINVDRTLIENYLETEGKNGELTASTRMFQRTNVSTRTKLKNIKIDKTYFSSSEGLYYVLAYLNRRETASLYQKDILKNQDKIDEYIQHFRDEPNKLRKYAYITKAIALSEINALINEQYQILTRGGNVTERITKATLVKMRNDLLDRITVNIEPQGNAPQEIEQYLREVIAKTGFKISDRKGDFTIKYAFDIRKSNLKRRRVVAYNWKITVDVYDNLNNVALNTFNVTQRTVAISKEEARAKAMRNAQKALNKKFLKFFMAYISKV